MSLRYWFVPAHCGDFRLEKDGDNASILSVVDPTADDLLKLLPFLSEAAKRGWTTVAALRVQPVGETKITLGVSLPEAGKLLADTVHGEADSSQWTAVRYEKGVLLIDGTDLPAEKEKEPEAAVTVKAPKRGCPRPTPADVRAGQVLSMFSTRRQMDSWRTHGFMPVVGGSTGKLYNLYHRNVAHHKGLERLLIRAEDQRPVCIYDPRVPPAEEVLAIKLAIEHRENWALGLTV